MGDGADELIKKAMDELADAIFGDEESDDLDDEYLEF